MNLEVAGLYIDYIRLALKDSCSFDEFSRAIIDKALAMGLGEGLSRHKVGLEYNKFALTYQGEVISEKNFAIIRSKLISTPNARGLVIDLISKPSLSTHTAVGVGRAVSAPVNINTTLDEFDAYGVESNILDGGFWLASDAIPTLAASTLFRKFKNQEPLFFSRDAIGKFEAALYGDERRGVFVGYGMRNLDFIKYRLVEFVPTEIYQIISISGCHWALVKINISKNSSGQISSSINYYDPLRWSAGDSVRSIARDIKNKLGLEPGINTVHGLKLQGDGSSCGFVSSDYFRYLIGCEGSDDLSRGGKYNSGAKELRLGFIRQLQDFNPNSHLNARSAAYTMFRDHTYNARVGQGRASVSSIKDSIKDSIKGKVTLCVQVLDSMLDYGVEYSEILLEVKNYINSFPGDVSKIDDILEIFRGFNGSAHRPKNPFIPYVVGKLTNFKGINPEYFADLQKDDPKLRVILDDFFKEFIVEQQEMEDLKSRLRIACLFDHCVFKDEGGDIFVAKESVGDLHYVLDETKRNLHTVPGVKIYQLKEQEQEKLIKEYHGILDQIPKQESVELLFYLHYNNVYSVDDSVCSYDDEKKVYKIALFSGPTALIDFDNVNKIVKSAVFKKSDGSYEPIELSWRGMERKLMQYLERKVGKKIGELEREELGSKAKILSESVEKFLRDKKINEVYKLDYNGKSIDLQKSAEGWVIDSNELYISHEVVADVRAIKAIGADVDFERLIKQLDPASAYRTPETHMQHLLNFGLLPEVAPTKVLPPTHEDIIIPTSESNSRGLFSRIAEKELESLLPSTTISTATYDPLEKTGYYSTHELERGNKFRVISKVYDGVTEVETQQNIKDAIICAMVCAAKDSAIVDGSGKIDLDKVIEIINKAKRQGGIANIKLPYAEQSDVNSRKFSALFQKNCEDMGIITGRDKNTLKKIVGLRLAFFPDSILREINVGSKFNMDWCRENKNLKTAAVKSILSGLSLSQFRVRF